MTVQADVELLRNAYDAFARRDLPAVLDIMHPDIEWVIPAGASFGGVHRGHVSAVRKVLMSAPADGNAFRTEPEEFLEAGGAVVVLGNHRGRVGGDGAEFEIPFAHVWELRDGLVVRCRSYVDTAQLNAVLAAGPSHP
ncbi:MAG: nuclear transport factor 2 family protein [Actinomycetota bacterium]